MGPESSVRLHTSVTPFIFSRSNAPPNAYQQAPQTENYETGSPTNGSYDPSTGSTYVDPSNADPYTSSDPTATNASEEDEEEPDSPTGSDNGDEPYSPDSDGGDGPNSPTSPLNQQIDNTNPFSR